MSPTKPHYIEKKLTNPIIQMGLRKEADLPHVALMRDLATEPAGKSVLDFMSKAVSVGRAVATTPGVPSDVLRRCAAPSMPFERSRS